MKLYLLFLLIILTNFICLYNSFSFKSKSFYRFNHYHQHQHIIKSSSNNINEINTNKKFIFELEASSSNTLSKRNMKTIVEIEYCYKCKWMLRSTWLAQELLQTFEDKINIEIILKPSNDPGTFQVTVGLRLGLDTAQEHGHARHIVWDRRIEGGFPEAKHLKQRIRDVIAPQLDLGHSDSSKSRNSNDSSPTVFNKNSKGNMYIKDDIFDNFDTTTDNDVDNDNDEVGYDGSYDYDVDTDDDDSFNGDVPMPIDVEPIIKPPDPIIW